MSARMSFRPLILVLALAIAGLAGLSVSAQEPEAPAEAAASTSQVERGQYLVHSVAMCVQCHSPRNRRGELLTDRLLEGGAVPVESPFVGPRWAFTAPNLKRIPGYTEAEFVRLLTQGITRLGSSPRGPMPPFRMVDEDARAVWSYLRSIRPES